MGTGISITERGGVHYLRGELDEYADLSPLLSKAEPLRLDLRDVSRFNSIGVRNLLKFLNGWGKKALSYEHCPSEFIDQLSMIPALLGSNKQGQVVSLYVPYECLSCDYEQDIFGELRPYAAAVAGSPWPQEICPKCGAKLALVSDTFFAFLSK